MSSVAPDGLARFSICWCRQGLGRQIPLPRAYCVGQRSAALDLLSLERHSSPTMCINGYDSLHNMLRSTAGTFLFYTSHDLGWCKLPLVAFEATFCGGRGPPPLSIRGFHHHLVPGVYILVYILYIYYIYIYSARAAL